MSKLASDQKDTKSERFKWYKFDPLVFLNSGCSVGLSTPEQLVAMKIMALDLAGVGVFADPRLLGKQIQVHAETVRKALRNLGHIVQRRADSSSGGVFEKGETLLVLTTFPGVQNAPGKMPLEEPRSGGTDASATLDQSPDNLGLTHTLPKGNTGATLCQPMGNPLGWGSNYSHINPDMPERQNKTYSKENITQKSESVDTLLGRAEADLGMSLKEFFAELAKVFSGKCDDQKGAARAFIAACGEGVRPELIVSQAKKYESGKDRKYMKNLTNWITQEGYLASYPETSPSRRVGSSSFSKELEEAFRPSDSSQPSISTDDGCFDDGLNL